MQDQQVKFEAVYLTPFLNSLKNGLGRGKIMKTIINGRKKKVDFILKIDFKSFSH